jgi:hypothetical protein
LRRARRIRRIGADKQAGLPLGAIQPVLFLGDNMKVLIAKKSVAERLLSNLSGIEKALSHKYIKRIPKKSGKGWNYIYAEHFEKPMTALKNFFNIKEEKVAEDYKNNNIYKDYGADKNAFAAHVLEYFINKIKWDAFFVKKENRDKMRKPQNMPAEKKASAEKLGGDGQSDLFSTKPAKEDKLILNRSLMRKVWEIYNPQAKEMHNAAEKTDSKAKENDYGERRENHTDAGQGTLPLDTQPVRTRGSEKNSGLDGSGAIQGAAADRGNAIQLPLDVGDRSGADVPSSNSKDRGGAGGGGSGSGRGRSDVSGGDSELEALFSERQAGEGKRDGVLAGLPEQRRSTHLSGMDNGERGVGSPDLFGWLGLAVSGEPGSGGRLGGGGRGRGERITAGQARSVRKACIALLQSKTDSEMTAEDKALLRQYEGAGGLGETDASTHGTLYEFYTPRNVVNKVWELVDKYVPGAKTVLEPSAGIGRFAENRPLDTFTLSEIDGTSSRIAKILNPGADVKQQAFQAMFKPGKPYTGQRYDVVIGNPPYGAYEGLWKGKGEGKEHSRYEEYFIDRGLDTLRDGGVMAFVVPSGFLDGGDDKIKAKIAEKGKLLEAWRLPNGIFSTTGVGTDIVIIRKEKGNSADFSNKGYFKDNHDHVLGDVTERTNQYGKLQEYVALRQGETFDGALNGIKADAVPVTVAGELSPKEAALENIEVQEESEAEKKKNRSNAMLGNDNAKKYGMTVEALDTDDGGGYGIRQVLKDGRIGWAGVMSPSGFGSGKKHFDSPEEAVQYMNDYADKRAEWEEKKEKKSERRRAENERIGAENRAWIETAIKNGGKREGKYLSDPKTGERLALTGLNLDLYNEVVSGVEAQERPESAVAGGVDSAAEFNAKYNKHIAPEALPIWKATQWDGSINVAELGNTKYLETSGNYVKTADGKWYDIVIYASGNIYDKLDKLETEKKHLSEAEYRRQKSILENALPHPKTVVDFEVSPLSNFARTFETSETLSVADKAAIDGKSKSRGKKTNQDSFYYSGGKAILTDAFKRWIGRTPNDELGLGSDITKEDVLNYVNKTVVRAARSKNADEKEASRAEAQRTITARREAGERLFNQYIREQLSLADQKRLEDAYNRQKNGTVQADYSKIPVFLDGISRVFKDKEFKANESQIKGVSWLAGQGNGIVAFDVGVGKTLTAIMSAVNDIQMGRCKKPLICVPKSVYKNWIAEITQIFPGVKINELGNFGDLAKIKNPDGTLNIDDNSISLCTHEALAKVGFKEETLQGELAESFKEATSRITNEDREAAANGKKGAMKKVAKDDEDIMTKVGKASRTGDNWVHWEDSGFDHITVDEAHNFRHSFTKPHNMEKGSADEFRDIPSGDQSLRGLKLFAVTQMIQSRNNGRNVHLLTATPFQNSPVEIYNMLSYVAKKRLEESGIYNFHEFLTQFAELKSELVVDSKSNIIQKNVMKGFKNLSALQSLLNQYCMKINGEDAGIIRPDKQEHIVELNPSAEQQDITEKIRAYMEANPDPEADPGATLRCINALRQAALSPALVDGFAFLDVEAAGKAGIQESAIHVKNKDFVKDSPKLRFTCDTAANLHKLHPDKGQIIHLPQGVEHYGAVKKYLVSQGVPADSIAFLAPDYLKASDAGNDQKEAIVKEFNDPKSKLKIIIGSDTIKEGVNLNGNTIQTYSTFLAWNPTDTQQLKGRSWRQGNKQGMVHITFPLINDSVDSFMFQKHDEKGARLDALWDSQKEKMEIETITPEELKFALIKDPKRRADLVIKEKTADLIQKKKIASAASDKIFTMAGERKDIAEDIETGQSEVKTYKRRLDTFAAKTDKQLKIETYGNRFYYEEDEDMYIGGSIKEIREKYAEGMKELIAGAQKSIQRNKSRMTVIDNTLKRYGVTDPGNENAVERVRKDYINEAMQYESQIDRIAANRNRYIREAAEQIKKEAKPGQSVDTAVLQNTKTVSENLYSMDVVKAREEAKAKKNMKKSIGKRILLVIRKSIVAQIKERL